MSLNADYSKIDNYEALYVDAPDGGKKLGTVWETLVLYTMPVGLNEIVEKNVDEWFFRLKVLEKLHGKNFSMLCQECDGKGIVPTTNDPDAVEVDVDHCGNVRGYKLCDCDRGVRRFDFGYSDVRRMIGLRTNATKLTRNAFLANCKKVLERQGLDAARYDKREWDQGQADAERLGQPWQLWGHPLNEAKKADLAEQERLAEVKALTG